MKSSPVHRHPESNPIKSLFAYPGYRTLVRCVWSISPLTFSSCFVFSHRRNGTIFLARNEWVLAWNENLWWVCEPIQIRTWLVLRIISWLDDGDRQLLLRMQKNGNLILFCEVTNWSTWVKLRENKGKKHFSTGSKYEWEHCFKNYWISKCKQGVFKRLMRDVLCLRCHLLQIYIKRVKIYCRVALQSIR